MSGKQKKMSGKLLVSTSFVFIAGFSLLPLFFWEGNAKELATDYLTTVNEDDAKYIEITLKHSMILLLSEG